MILNKSADDDAICKGKTEKTGGCEFQQNEKAIILTYLICYRASQFEVARCTFIGRLILCPPSSSAPGRLRHCTSKQNTLCFL
jgi:hypothetical protein